VAELGFFGALLGVLHTSNLALQLAVAFFSAGQCQIIIALLHVWKCSPLAGQLRMINGMHEWVAFHNHLKVSEIFLQVLVQPS
jgi:hypothetical protein